MKYLTFTALFALASAAPTSIQKRAIPAKAGFSVIFADDFTGPAGTFPSDTNWDCLTGTSYPGGPANWGNNEVQTYRRDYSNLVTTAQQTMSIKAQKLANGQWTSARIESKRGDFVANGGKKLYIETRVKLGGAAAANQQGIWPAFWSMGTAFRGNYQNWPFASEWDIVESINGQNTIHSVLHCGVAPGGPCNEFNGLGVGTAFVRNDWNVVGFQVDRSESGFVGAVKGWKDEEVSWYLNGKKVYSVKGIQVGDYNTWVQIAQKPHFLIFNVAVGGNWAGAPNAQTLGGETTGMEIDYVAVYNSV